MDPLGYISQALTASWATSSPAVLSLDAFRASKDFRAVLRWRTRTWLGKRMGKRLGTREPFPYTQWLMIIIPTKWL